MRSCFLPVKQRDNALMRSPSAENGIHGTIYRIIYKQSESYAK